MVEHNFPCDSKYQSIKKLILTFKHRQTLTQNRNPTVQFEELKEKKKIKTRNVAYKWMNKQKADCCNADWILNRYRWYLLSRSTPKYLEWKLSAIIEADHDFLFSVFSFLSRMLLYRVDLNFSMVNRSKLSANETDQKPSRNIKTTQYCITGTKLFRSKDRNNEMISSENILQFLSGI